MESVGILRRVFRRRAGEGGFFCAGNYPHPRSDRLFQLGANWGQAANTHLRERFLETHARPLQGRLDIPGAISLMQTHEAGGMCQHHHDNPGQLHTVCSSIAVTRTGELFLSHGAPCQVGYVRYRLTGNPGPARVRR